MSASKNVKRSKLFLFFLLGIKSYLDNLIIYFLLRVFFYASFFLRATSELKLYVTMQQNIQFEFLIWNAYFYLLLISVLFLLNLKRLYLRNLFIFSFVVFVISTLNRPIRLLFTVFHEVAFDEPNVKWNLAATLILFLMILFYFIFVRKWLRFNLTELKKQL